MNSIIFSLLIILFNIAKSKISIKKFIPVNIYLVIDNFLTEIKINSEIKYAQNPTYEQVNSYNFTYDLSYGDILNVTLYNFNGPAGLMSVFEMTDPNGNYIYETTENEKNGWESEKEMSLSTYYRYGINTNTKEYIFYMFIFNNINKYYHTYFNAYLKFPFIFPSCKNDSFLLQYKNGTKEIEFKFNLINLLIIESQFTELQLPLYIVFKENTHNLYDSNNETIISNHDYLYNETFIYRTSDFQMSSYKYYFQTIREKYKSNDCIFDINSSIDYINSCFVTCDECYQFGNKIRHKCITCKNNYTLSNNILYHDNCVKETIMNIDEVLVKNIDYFIDNYIEPVGNYYVFYLYPFDLSGIKPKKSKRTCFIDLSPCLNILKKIYDNLYIEEIEIIKSDYQMNNILYSIYDNNFNKINLGLCTNKTKITCNIKDYYNKTVETIKKEKIDLFNAKIEFYNGHCFQKKKEKYKHIYERRDYFPYFEIPTECNYDSININHNTISVSCDIQTERKLSSYKPLELNEYKKKHNIIYLKCINLLSSSHNVFVNIGFWFILCILILKIYLIYRFNYKDIPNLKLIISEENKVNDIDIKKGVDDSEIKKELDDTDIKKEIDDTDIKKEIDDTDIKKEVDDSDIKKDKICDGEEMATVTNIKYEKNNTTIENPPNSKKTSEFRNFSLKITKLFGKNYKITKVIFTKDKFNQISYNLSVCITELIFYFLFGVILFDYSDTFHFIEYDKINLKINYMRAFYSFIFGFILQKILLILGIKYTFNQFIDVKKIDLYKRKNNEFLFLDLLFILFLWYYFTIFCVIFNSKQWIWFYFSIISVLFEIIFILCLCFLFILLEIYFI